MNGVNERELNAYMNQEQLVRVFTHIPTLKTPRLILRKIKVCDAEDMFDYSRREDVTRYLLWDAHPDLFYTEHFIRYLQERYSVADYYDWAIVWQENGKMIGTCGFTSFDVPNNAAEIGYALSPEYWGRGVATEAVERLLRFAFCDLALSRVSAVCMEGNAASLRVMEKCGMKREGLLRSAIVAKGERKSVFLSAITLEDYRRRISEACT